MKIVDENILDGAITSLADALRSRGHFSDKMTFPDGFISKIETGHFFSGQKKYITPMSVPQLISADNGYDCITEAVAYGDAALTSNNIQRGISIFGVEGNFSGTEVTDDYICGNLEVEITDKVTYIPSYFYCNRKNLKNLALPNCRSIGEGAFQGCNNLELLSLDTYPSTLASSMFYGNTNLKNVYAPCAAAVGSWCFFGCLALTSINLDSIRYISYGTFYKCYSLKDVSLKECYYYVGTSAFGLCTGLEKITIEKCIDIYDWAFSQCTSLESVELPACISIRQEVFICCYNLKYISIPNVVNIGAFAFWECSSLKSIILEKCSQIKNSCFYSCRSLSDLYLLSNSVVGSNFEASNDPFNKTPITGYSSIQGRIHVPVSLYDSYLSAWWSRYLSYGTQIVSIPEGDSVYENIE